MSLVNDMLRDLENRRAAPTERLALDGLYAADEAGAARRERLERLRRGSIWFLAVMLLAVLVGLMIGRVVKGQIAWNGEAPEQAASVTPALAPVAPAAAPVQRPRLLEVLPQNDDRGLTLQLLLERSVAYRRSEEAGAVSLLLPGVELEGEAPSGRVQRNGRSLSWRVSVQGNDVQVLLVGLGEQLQVRDRLERAGDRWMLWVDVPLAAEEMEEAQADLLDLQPAMPAVQAETAALSDWPAEPVVAPAPRAAAVMQPVERPQVKIEPYRPDELAQARQAIQSGDYRRAIAGLEPLHKRRPSDPEVRRWLARAYLGAGQTERLLNWLPGQLAKQPDDVELRLLLARAQLQAGRTRSAVATLERYSPPLSREPSYYALLAASYQQTGQWRESAQLYQQLLAMKPRQASWQLGLAIALEQVDQPAEAARHYRLALADEGLDDGARHFAGERAQALGGGR